MRIQSPYRKTLAAVSGVLLATDRGGAGTGTTRRRSHDRTGVELPRALPERRLIHGRSIDHLLGLAAL
jgi:hypothetical protein